MNSIKTFNKYRYLLFSLVGRDLKVKYRRSILGIVWSILNPLMMMVVITTVFSQLFRFPIPNFHLYYLTGSLIYNFISEATTGSLTSVLGASSLIKKVYIPKYIFPLQKCLFAFVNLLFSLSAVVIVMLFTPGVVVTPTILLFWVPLVYALIFSIGLSFLLSSMTIFFRDVIHLYGVFLVAWMYATPIIYPIGSVPPLVQMIMKLNPMYYFVTYFREVVLYDTIPGIRFNLVCAFVSFAMLFIGALVFKKTQDKFIMHI